MNIYTKPGATTIATDTDTNTALPEILKMSKKHTTTVIRFNACAHLDFSDNYTAKKQILGGGKVFWLRDVPNDLPAMVQFCLLRGRLNSPTACLCERDKQCSHYLEKEHLVHVPNA